MCFFCKHTLLITIFLFLAVLFANKASAVWTFDSDAPKTMIEVICKNGEKIGSGESCSGSYATVEVKCEDPVSKCLSIKYKDQNGEKMAKIDPPEESYIYKEIVRNTGEKYDVVAESFDVAGNRSKASFSFTFNSSPSWFKIGSILIPNPIALLQELLR